MKILILCYLKGINVERDTATIIPHKFYFIICIVVGSASCHLLLGLLLFIHGLKEIYCSVSVC